MDTICLCMVCSCKGFRKENLEMKEEIIELKKKILEMEKAYDTFEKCDVCESVQQYQKGCRRCDITLCTRCYDHAVIMDKVLYDEKIGRYNYQEDTLLYMAKYNIEEYGMSILCKHLT